MKSDALGRRMTEKWDMGLNKNGHKNWRKKLLRVNILAKIERKNKMH